MLQEATEFIVANKSEPFFMFYAMNTPHYPYQGTPEWLAYYQNKGVAYPRDLFGAFLSTMDDNIGKLIQKLKDQGIHENTIIVFQSDNGHSTEIRAHGGGETLEITEVPKPVCLRGAYAYQQPLAGPPNCLRVRYGINWRSMQIGCRPWPNCAG